MDIRSLGRPIRPLYSRPGGSVSRAALSAAFTRGVGRRGAAGRDAAPARAAEGVPGVTGGEGPGRGGTARGGGGERAPTGGQVIFSWKLFTNLDPTFLS